MYFGVLMRVCWDFCAENTEVLTLLSTQLRILLLHGEHKHILLVTFGFQKHTRMHGHNFFINGLIPLLLKLNVPVAGDFGHHGTLSFYEKLFKGVPKNCPKVNSGNLNQKGIFTAIRIINTIIHKFVGIIIHPIENCVLIILS